MTVQAIQTPINSRRQINGRRQMLTQRQRQVLALVALEYTTEEIASMISRDSKTVESHLANIYQKFHVRSRLGAVLKAMSHGELPVDDGELLRLGCTS